MNADSYRFYNKISAKSEQIELWLGTWASQSREASLYMYRCWLRGWQQKPRSEWSFRRRASSCTRFRGQQQGSTHPSIYDARDWGEESSNAHSDIYLAMGYPAPEEVK